MNPAAFASKVKLRKMTAKFNSFGPRILGSSSHSKSISWLEKKARGIGLKTSSTWYRTYSWLPRARFARGPGLNIAAAGGLSVHRTGEVGRSIKTGGAVHWSKATGRKGRTGDLVYLPPDQDITTGNAAGKIVIRDFELGSIPFGGLKVLLGLHLSSDLEDYGTYTRPYLSPNLHEDSLAASAAGASGVIFVFDVPQSQVRGYYDPHVGTIYRQPELFVGRSQGEQLK